MTRAFLDLKRSTFPGLCCKRGTTYLGAILPEIKGAELRKHVGRGTSKQARHSIRYLDGVLKILSDRHAAMFARIWIKGVGGPFDGKPVYTSSLQAIYTYFQNFLASRNDHGFVILDSRTKGLNVPVAHSIFTQKFRAMGDNYERIYEMPTFSHSDNHAGLQLCDALGSALLFPICSFVYCSGHVNNVHVQPRYTRLKTRYAPALQALQYRYQDATGAYKGGIVVADAIARRSSRLLFV
jgi:Protein of unknown function (DUF3800)